MAEYDIFISCKSEDYEIAEKVYSFLKDNGFSVFLASQELRKIAITAYMDSISKALDSVYSMIVVSTKKEYLESEWVKLEWSTFLCEILSGRKTGQIMTLVENIKVGELPTLLRTYQSIALGNYEEILPYLEKMKKPEETNESTEEDQPNVNNERTGAAGVHIKTDIDCRVMHFNKEVITAHSNTDNLIHLKKGYHELTFVSFENEQDNYSQVFTIKDDCEFLQVNLTKIRDARLAKEEAERLAKQSEERKRLAEDDAKYHVYVENILYGFKKDGVVVISAKYDDALSFHEGLAGVKLNGKWGYIDKIGNEVIHLNYEWVGHFRESLARVELNGKYGYIDRLGNEVIPIKYEGAESFSEGLAAVKLNGKYGYIDKTGKEVIPFKYDYTLSFSEELAPVKLNDKWGYIDKTDKVVIPFKYENAQDFSEGLAAVKLNDKWGFIDKTDKVVIPFKYKDAKHFSEGLAPVWFIDKNDYKKVVASTLLFTTLALYLGIGLMGKWGYIDKTDKVVIPFKYVVAEPFSDGRAKVAKLNFKRGIIDKQGNFTPDE